MSSSDRHDQARVLESVTDPADANVTVACFRPGGWLTGGGDAALIRVLAGPAQVLITIVARHEGWPVVDGQMAGRSAAS